MQIVNPRFESVKKLKNLKLTIRLYDDSVMVNINDKQGYLVFDRSYNDFDDKAFGEIKAYIDMYDNEIKSKKISGIEKMYYELSNRSFL